MGPIEATGRGELVQVLNCTPPNLRPCFEAVTRTMRYMLLPVTTGAPILFDRPLLILGRHPQCDVRFDSRRVSRFHCCLANLGERGILVRDLGSTNGTYVNNQRVREARIGPGDRLRLAGEIEYCIERAGEPRHTGDSLSIPTSSQIELPSPVVPSSDSDNTPQSEELRLDFGDEDDEKLDAELADDSHNGERS